jgi:hypothetical protein
MDLTQYVKVDAITATVISVAAIVLRKKIEIFLNWLLKIISMHIKKIFKTSYTLDAPEVNRNRQIDNKLIELRTILKADRSYVFQFHNGSVFNSNNPIWRLSNTHETVSDGVASEINELQNIIASSIMTLISCFWDDVNLPKGVCRVSPENCICENKKDCKLPEGVFIYVVDELMEGFSKAHLAKQGIRYAMVAPLHNGEHRIGFIGVDYTREIGIEDITKYATDICKHASAISYILLNRQ